jgi:hypothetical protein
MKKVYWLIGTPPYVIVESRDKWRTSTVSPARSQCYKSTAQLGCAYAPFLARNDIADALTQVSSCHALSLSSHLFRRTRVCPSVLPTNEV